MCFQAKIIILGVFYFLHRKWVDKIDIMLERILELVGDQHGAAKAFSDALGLKANVLTEWKKGRLKSYTKYAPQIADRYGVTLDWLSGKSDVKFAKKGSPSDQKIEEAALDRELVRLLCELESPQDQQRVKDFVQGLLSARKE